MATVQLYGIEKSKEFVAAVLSVVQEAVAAGADGWQFMDLFKLAGQTGNINIAIQAFPQVKVELGEWSPEERTEFFTFFAEKFNIGNEKLEAFIEHAIDYGLRGVDFVNEGIALIAEFKAIKTPPPLTVTNPPV